MAFTLAHPAAVIPLRNLPFMALVPLVLGSVMPDLIGFLPYKLAKHLPHSHSPMGTVLVDLPAGYLLLALLLWLRGVLTQPLWEPHRKIVAASLNEFFTLRHRWLIAAPSLLVGTWTHIVWDRFTHEGSWTYRNLPVLYQPVFPDGSHPLPLFHFLQYSTSVAGLIYIAWQYVSALQQFKVSHSPPFNLSERKLHIVLALATAAMAAGGMRLLMANYQFDSIYERLSLVLKTALICFALLYLAMGLILAKAVSRSAQRQ